MQDDSLIKLEQIKTELNVLVFNKIINKHSSKIQTIYISSGENFSSKLNFNYIYFINKGYVLQFCVDPVGGEKALDINGNNDILGIETMYNDMTTFEQSLALTRVELKRIPIKILKPYIYEFPFFIYNNLQYSLFIQKIDLLGTLLPGDQRVLLTIIELLRYLGKKENDTIVIPNFITHKIIAMFSSVSRSYVSKILIKLTKQGYLFHHGRLIACNDLDNLISLSIYFNQELQD